MIPPSDPNGNENKKDLGKPEANPEHGEVRGQAALSQDSTIYESCKAANDALGPCPRALVNSDGGHWWYVDTEADVEDPFPAIKCVCKTCPQTMWLSPDAEEYPV